MWDDSSVVEMIDNGHHIAKIARGLIWDALPNGWVLKSKDVIHLASAMWYDRHVGRVGEFHTYDERFLDCQVGLSPTL
jgi:hypothetical protein